jgi:SAM-dependent methyltransferase
MTGEADDTIGLCLRGAISPEVAVARLLLGGEVAAGIAGLVAARRPDPPTPRWAALARLVEGRTAALDSLAAEIATVGGDHTGFGSEGGLARVAAFFDRQAARTPEAGVALYSLGDPAILAAATAEIVAWLDAEGLLGPRPGMAAEGPPEGPDVLDLGCGIGRMAAALAPRCRSVLGLDVSAGMVAEARRRCAGLGNVRFEVTAGEDLAAVAEGAFDLVLAVDSFPYIVQVGEDLAERHVAGAARALRAGGALAVLNLSYRQDLAADRADAAGWAERHGFAVARAGTQPFELWDGVAFVLRRPCSAH